MIYTLEISNKFKKDAKLSIKRGLNQVLLAEVVNTLLEKGVLPPKFKAHKLSGKYKDSWECHIQPDWLLIWDQNETIKLISLIRTGTHSDLF